VLTMDDVRFEIFGHSRSTWAVPSLHRAADAVTRPHARGLRVGGG
jgi:hypothetical protein